MKVKSESEVAQMYIIRSDPMNCMQPARLLHPWDFPARVLEWVDYDEDLANAVMEMKSHELMFTEAGSLSLKT